MITIEQIKELLEKATKDKWTSAGRNINGEHGKSIIDTGCGCCCSSDTNKPEDFNFIAALPEIAQLCLDQAAEIEQLKAEIADRNIEALSQSCPACTKTGNIHINCIMR